MGNENALQTNIGAFNLACTTFSFCSFQFTNTAFFNSTSVCIFGYLVCICLSKEMLKEVWSQKVWTKRTGHWRLFKSWFAFDISAWNSPVCSWRNLENTRRMHLEDWTSGGTREGEYSIHLRVVVSHLVVHNVSDAKLSC